MGLVSATACLTLTDPVLFLSSGFAQHDEPIQNQLMVFVSLRACRSAREAHRVDLRCLHNFHPRSVHLALAIDARPSNYPTRTAIRAMPRSPDAQDPSPMRKQMLSRARLRGLVAATALSFLPTGAFAEGPVIAAPTEAGFTSAPA
jgi:hypothetical protein